MTRAVVLALPAELDPAGWSAPIAGSSALRRVVASVCGIGQVVVAVAEAHGQRAREALSAKDFDGVAVLPVSGPADRRRCLSAALDHVVAEPLCATEVLVHDVRHPLAPAELARRVASALADADVVVPTVAMTDSVKIIGAQGFVRGNVDRAELCTVQYPRGYAVAALARELDGEDLVSVAHAVDGDPNAFAVDLVCDGVLVEAILTAG